MYVTELLKAGIVKAGIVKAGIDKAGIILLVLA